MIADVLSRFRGCRLVSRARELAHWVMQPEPEWEYRVERSELSYAKPGGQLGFTNGWEPMSVQATPTAGGVLSVVVLMRRRVSGHAPGRDQSDGVRRVAEMRGWR